MTDPTLDPIQMLWIGENFSDLERLALASFAANGHTVHLYAYDELAGVPAGVSVMDAREILAEDRIFRYGPQAGTGEGSVASFADLFRFKLLLERGGWWADTDMVCLRPFDFEAPYVFGCEANGSINCAVLRLPEGSKLAESLYQSALALGTKTKWGETGPQLLMQKVAEFELERFALSPRAFYPVPYDFTELLFKADNSAGLLAAMLEGAYGVHFWNEFLRRHGKDKNGSYPPTSIYEKLKARYRIETGHDQRSP